jgi:2-oxoisovalerate dehydrogenase E1 component alpha subunit
MTSSGEEATQIGSAAALDMNDMVFAQYREPGILLWRGFPLQNFADQCFSNIDDLGHGRQMPVHYGSNTYNYQTISSPLATQIPQAVGAAYALKRQGLPQISVCYFGEGAASEGDFHAAMNFASTLDCPVVFICRNNGYAISTPTRDQYRGDGIVSRAPGYGMAAIRVDGNDVLAMYAATKEARSIALSDNKPVLIEAMTYRVGHHSTSDDWSSYRVAEEVKPWQNQGDPLSRLLQFMIDRGDCDELTERKLTDIERINVIAALEVAESKGNPPISTMFTDVYSKMPPNLVEQEKEMLQHIQKYPDHY